MLGQIGIPESSVKCKCGNRVAYFNRISREYICLTCGRVMLSLLVVYDDLETGVHKKREARMPEAPEEPD